MGDPWTAVPVQPSSFFFYQETSSDVPPLHSFTSLPPLHVLPVFNSCRALHSFSAVLNAAESPRVPTRTSLPDHLAPRLILPHQLRIGLVHPHQVPLQHPAAPPPFTCHPPSVNDGTAYTRTPPAMPEDLNQRQLFVWRPVHPWKTLLIILPSPCDLQN